MPDEYKNPSDYLEQIAEHMSGEIIIMLKKEHFDKGNTLLDIINDDDSIFEYQLKNKIERILEGWQVK